MTFEVPKEVCYTVYIWSRDPRSGRMFNGEHSSFDSREAAELECVRLLRSGHVVQIIVQPKEVT